MQQKDACCFSVYDLNLIGCFYKMRRYFSFSLFGSLTNGDVNNQQVFSKINHVGSVVVTMVRTYVRTFPRALTLIDTYDSLQKHWFSVAFFSPKFTTTSSSNYNSSTILLQHEHLYLYLLVLLAHFRCLGWCQCIASLSRGKHNVPGTTSNFFQDELIMFAILCQSDL